MTRGGTHHSQDLEGQGSEEGRGEQTPKRRKNTTAGRNQGTRTKGPKAPGQPHPHGRKKSEEPASKKTRGQKHQEEGEPDSPRRGDWAGPPPRWARQSARSTKSGETPGGWRGDGQRPSREGKQQRHSEEEKKEKERQPEH